MLRTILILLFVASVSGCSSLLSPQKTPAMNNYTLTSVSTTKTRGMANRSTLLVSKTTGSTNLQTQNMLYVTRRYQLEPFTKNQWSAPPAQMFYPLLVQSLQNSKHFHAVVTPPFSGKDNIQLTTQLVTLQQDFLQNPSVVRMVVNAELIDAKSDKVIATKRISATAKTPQNNPYGGVMAANQITKKILQQIVQFVSSET